VRRSAALQGSAEALRNVQFERSGDSRTAEAMFVRQAAGNSMKPKTRLPAIVCGRADNLFYVFVRLNGTAEPAFHIVPRAVVAKFVRREHSAWLKTQDQKP
jgi:hypothetical protein